MLKIQKLFLVLLVGFLALGWFTALQATQDPTAGKQLFLSRCSMCHGEDGKGNASMARILQVDFEPMESEYVQSKSYEEFEEIITKGRNKMLPIRGLQDAQISDIVAYIKTLAKEQPLSGSP